MRFSEICRLYALVEGLWGSLDSKNTKILTSKKIYLHKYCVKKVNLGKLDFSSAHCYVICLSMEPKS